MGKGFKDIALPRNWSLTPQGCELCIVIGSPRKIYRAISMTTAAAADIGMQQSGLAMTVVLVDCGGSGWPCNFQV